MGENLTSHWLNLERLIPLNNTASYAFYVIRYNWCLIFTMIFEADIDILEFKNIEIIIYWLCFLRIKVCAG